VSTTGNGPDLAGKARARAASGRSLGGGSCVNAVVVRRPRMPGLTPVAIAWAIVGCSRAPTINLFGSYFPAWMLCAAGGIGATVVIWKILALAGISEYVVAPFLTYAGLALSATLIAWLLWF